MHWAQSYRHKATGFQLTKPCIGNANAHSSNTVHVLQHRWPTELLTLKACAFLKVSFNGEILRCLKGISTQLCTWCRLDTNSVSLPPQCSPGPAPLFGEASKEMEENPVSPKPSFTCSLGSQRSRARSVLTTLFPPLPVATYPSIPRKAFSFQAVFPGSSRTSTLRWRELSGDSQALASYH